MFLRRLAASAALVSVLVGTAAARAWNFPEHAELTRLALDHRLPPAARASLARAVREAAPHLMLCDALSVPMSELSDAPCVPFSVLPALAGDHAVDADDLRRALTEQPPAPRGAVGPRAAPPSSTKLAPLAQRVTRAVGGLFAGYLADAPPDIVRLYRSNVSSDAVHSTGASTDLQRAFMRRVDIRVEHIDAEYSTRAGGSRAHFQDSARSMHALLHAAAAAGDLGNALGQVMSHHARSLQLALRVRSSGGEARTFALSEALLEHALALHFLQDAFAAGHIGTEPAVVDSIRRLRRHDFLNRVGLSVGRTFATQACQSPFEPFGNSESCWIAYGDGYLDWNNARIIASASVRLQLELAMALDPSIVHGALGRCGVDTAQRPRRWDITNTLSLDAAEARDADPATQIEGPHVVHVYKRDLAQGERVRVELSSPAFDTFLQIRREGEQSWRNDDASVLTTDSAIELRVPSKGEYFIRVSAAKPNGQGGYRLSLFDVDAPTTSPNCTALLELYETLDPTPSWAMSEAARRDRRNWTDSQKRDVATQVVTGVAAALEKLERTPLLAKASANGVSSALPGALTFEVLGDPLEPCVADEAWTDRAHPLCRGPSARFRFEAIDASLWRPILVIWPASSGDVRIGEGEDSFGWGLATQVIFGGGGAVGVGREPVPFAVAPFFGGGVSLRIDNLFPSRVNREVLGLDFGMMPTFTSGLQTRYATLGFIEARAPVWAVLGAAAFGREASLGPIEIGPTGFRTYWELPQRLPNDGGQWLGWDVEVLNVRLNPVQARRTASIGSRMDYELRVRVGRIQLGALDEPRPEAIWTLGAEITGGYSVFVLQ